MKYYCSAFLLQHLYKQKGGGISVEKKEMQIAV